MINEQTKENMSKELTLSFTPTKTDQNEKLTTPVFALFLYFLKEGEYETKITKKYLPSLCKKYNYDKKIDNLNNTIIEILKKSAKDPINELNLSQVIKLLDKYPKSKAMALNEFYTFTKYLPEKYNLLVK